MLSARKAEIYDENSMSGIRSSSSKVQKRQKGKPQLHDENSFEAELISGDKDAPMKTSSALKSRKSSLSVAGTAQRRALGNISNLQLPPRTPSTVSKKTQSIQIYSEEETTEVAATAKTESIVNDMYDVVIMTEYLLFTLMLYTVRVFKGEMLCSGANGSKEDLFAQEMRRAEQRFVPYSSTSFCQSGISSFFTFWTRHLRDIQ